eukprot:Rmarinus@m.15415
MDVVKLTATASPSKIPIGKTTKVKILIEVETGSLELKNKVPPMSLGCVLDVSGSMGGEPIENCRAAMTEVADKLRKGDELHLSTYGSTAQTVFSNMSVKDRDEIKRRVSKIGIDGCTNMVAGIAKGYGQLCGSDLEREVFGDAPEVSPPALSTLRRRSSAALQWVTSIFHKSEASDGTGSFRRRSSLLRRPSFLRRQSASGKHTSSDRVRRMFLFSDGLVNEGVTNHAAITKLVRKAAVSGDMSVCAFGVGHDYDEKLMLAISECGGGKYYYIEGAFDIQRVLGLAFDNMERVFGVEAILRIKETSNHGKITFMNDIEEGKREAKIGDLNSEDVSLLYLEMEVTPPKGANVDDELDVLSYALQWLHIPDDKRKVTKEGQTLRVSVVHADATDLVEESVDVAVEEYAQVVHLAKMPEIADIDNALQCEADYVTMETQRVGLQGQIQSTLSRMDEEEEFGGARAEKARRVKKMVMGVDKFNNRTIKALQQRSKAASSKALQHERYTHESLACSGFY